MFRLLQSCQRRPEEMLVIAEILLHQWLGIGLEEWIVEELMRAGVCLMRGGSVRLEM